MNELEIQFKKETGLKTIVKDDHGRKWDNEIYVEWLENKYLELVRLLKTTDLRCKECYFVDDIEKEIFNIKDK